MDEWAKNFHELLNTPFGQELIRTLKEDLHASLIEDAENCDDPQIAYGLLKEASGVIKVIGHLNSRAFLPKDGGSGN